MNSNNEFDYKLFEHELMKHLQSGMPLSGRNGVPAPLLKRLIEAGLQDELGNHLREEKAFFPNVRNRRNILMRKRVKTGYGSMEVHTSRDHEGSFEPKILPEIEQWQIRPLKKVCPAVLPNAIHCKVRENNAIKIRAVYCLTGVDRN